jgi:hypothetical protein
MPLSGWMLAWQHFWLDFDADYRGWTARTWPG